MLSAQEMRQAATNPLPTIVEATLKAAQGNGNISSVEIDDLANDPVLVADLLALG